VCCLVIITGNIVSIGASQLELGHRVSDLVKLGHGSDGSHNIEGVRSGNSGYSVRVMGLV